MAGTQGTATRRAYVVRLTDRLDAMARARCLAESTTITSLVRDGLERVALGVVDVDFLPTLCARLDSAGRLFNEAAHQMNSCASRYDEPRRVRQADVESMLARTRASAASSADATSAMAPLVAASERASLVACVMVDESLGAGDTHYPRVIGLRLTDDERASLSAAAANRGLKTSAYVRMALAVACGPEGPAVVASPSVVGDLNRAAIRWSTNHGQIRDAASAVMRSQANSRYLTLEERDALRRSISAATKAADVAYARLAAVVSPAQALVGREAASLGLALVPVGDPLR